VKQVLLDTHAWVWSFAARSELSVAANEAIAAADGVFVSPISFFEVGQKVRIGKWPEMETLVNELPDVLSKQGGITAALTPEICLHASLREWSHRDPFDRFLASSAELLNMTLISKDIVFDELTGLKRVW